MKKYKNEKAGQLILKTYDELLAKWGCEVEEKDIETTYGTTHVITWGKEDAKPVVLFHGVGDDSALMWIYNAEYLGRYFRLYAIDTMGGPGKSIPNENYGKGYSDVKWIDEILDKLKLTKVCLVGVSNGSYLSQLYTLNRPEKVEKAICIAGAVHAKVKGGSMRALLKIFLPEALFPTDKNVYKLIRKLTGNNYKVFTDDEIIMTHYKGLLKGFNNMAMSYHKVMSFEDEQIDQIRDKVVFLAGEEDPFQKLGGKELLQKYHMQTFFYEKAGHGLNHELSEEINVKIVELLMK